LKIFGSTVFKFFEIMELDKNIKVFSFKRSASGGYICSIYGFICASGNAISIIIPCL
jgi:hypothetical protein